jgi:polysaccharide deacetylase 2 family uncharacterized protein YibQ
MATRGSVRRPVGFGWVVSWPLTTILGAMIFLSAQEIRHEGRGPVVEQGVLAGPDWEDRFPARVGLVSAALEQLPFGLQPSGQEPRGAGALRWTHFSYEAVVNERDRERAEAEIAALQALDPGLTVSSEATFSGTEVKVGLDGLLTHTLHLRWEERPERPRVALVMGSLGGDLRIARALVELDEPVALAVLPFHPFSKEVAILARMFQREVLVEIEAGDPPDTTDDSLPPGSTGDLDAALASLPDAVGVLAESDENRDLVETLQERGLLYVRVGGTLPAANGALVVALDTAVDGSFPAARVEELLSGAAGTGSAIGIGRPSEAAVEGLRALVARCRENSVDVVPLSALSPAP